MRNIDIVYKSREMLGQYKSVLIPVFLFISLVGFIPSLISNSLLTLIVSILVFPASQGLITSSLKVYRGSGESIDTYEDGLNGFRNWPRLFGTYFTYNFIKGIIFFIEVIVVTILVYMIFGDHILSAVEQMSRVSAYTYGSSYGYMIARLIEALAFVIVVLILPNVLVLVITNIIYDLYFFPTFYLLEEGVKGFEAMGVAKRLMKGNKKQLFLLKLSFFGWMILSAIVGGIVGVFLTNLLSLGGNGAYLVGGISGAIFSILFYRMRYQLALTIFYKEVVKGDETDMYNDYYEPREKETVNKESNSTLDDLIEDFNNKQLIKGVGIYLPLYFIGTVFIMSILFAWLMRTFGWTDTNFINSWFNFAVDGTLLVIALVMFKSIFQSAWHFFRSLSLKEIVRLSLVGYGLTYLVMVIGNMITLMLDKGGESVNQVAIENLMHNFPIPILVATIIFAPLIEEFVFRGIIFRALRRYNVVLAIIGSGFLFGFIHVSQSVFAGDFSQFFQIAPYMFMGFLYAYLYERTKTIAVPIYLHFLNNLVSALIILFL